MLIALEITAREAWFFTSVVPLDRFNVEDVASAFDHFSSLAAEAIIVITPMDSLAEVVVSVRGMCRSRVLMTCPWRPMQDRA